MAACCNGTICISSEDLAPSQTELVFTSEELSGGILEGASFIDVNDTWIAAYYAANYDLADELEDLLAFCRRRGFSARGRISCRGLDAAAYVIRDSVLRKVSSKELAQAEDPG